MFVLYLADFFVFAVKAILYVVNSAGYGTVLFEDETKNRMTEELELFKQVCLEVLFPVLIYK